MFLPDHDSSPNQDFQDWDFTSMNTPELRRLRMADILSLIQVYGKINSKVEVARELDIDPTKMIPGSGLPNTERLLRMCRLLDWSADMVAHHITGTTIRPSRCEHASLQDQFIDRIAQGYFEEALLVVDTAAAKNQLRPVNILDPVSESLVIVGLPGWEDDPFFIDDRDKDTIRVSEQMLWPVHRAYCHYALGHFFEAQAISSQLISELPQDVSTPDDICALALGTCHYLKGNSILQYLRREAQTLSSSAIVSQAQEAIGQLTRSSNMFESGKPWFHQSEYPYEVALAVYAPRLELEVMTGRKTASLALDEIKQTFQGTQHRHLTSTVKLVWSLHAASIALSQAKTNPSLLQEASQMLNLAEQHITERSSDGKTSWVLWEEYLRHKLNLLHQTVPHYGSFPRLPLNQTEREAMVGVMGRSPSFEPIARSFINLLGIGEK